jgi:steroid delta-isomerase
MRLWPLLGAMLLAVPAAADAPPDPETAIRHALTGWMEAFNARDAKGICGLFAPGLRYDVEGLDKEQSFDDICARLHRALAGTEITYRYGLRIKEIIVSGDLAVVRLVWDVTVSRPGAKDVTRPEQGMDVFRRQDDGSWKIIRYIAYGTGD